MFERLKDCICHPRRIAKYYKDRVGIVLLTIFLFLLFAITMQGVRCFTEKPFDEASTLAVTSAIIKYGDNSVQYDSNEHKLIGESITIDNSEFKLIILPIEEKISVRSDMINILLKEEEAIIYYGTSRISILSYQGLKVSSFSLKGVANNQATDIYNFKIFIQEVLDSSSFYFQTSIFLRGSLMTFVYYLICVLFCYVLSISINPTIDRKVRARLSFYDGCVFLVGSFFAYLFNYSIIVYFALALPLVYALITFRHIIKIVIKR